MLVSEHLDFFLPAFCIYWGWWADWSPKSSKIRKSLGHQRSQGHKWNAHVFRCMGSWICPPGCSSALLWRFFRALGKCLGAFRKPWGQAWGNVKGINPFFVLPGIISNFNRKQWSFQGFCWPVKVKTRKHIFTSYVYGQNFWNSCCL